MNPLSRRIDTDFEVARPDVRKNFRDYHRGVLSGARLSLLSRQDASGPSGVLLLIVPALRSRVASGTHLLRPGDERSPAPGTATPGGTETGHRRAALERRSDALLPCRGSRPFFGSSRRVATCQRAITPRSSSFRRVPRRVRCRLDPYTCHTVHGKRSERRRRRSRVEPWRQIVRPASVSNFTREKPLVNFTPLRFPSLEVSRTRRSGRRNHARNGDARKMRLSIRNHFTRFNRDHLARVSRPTRNQTGDARAKRASSSNGWRLTNLTFRSAPPRGHQRRISHDRPLRAFALGPPVARTRFLFLFAADPRSPLLSSSLLSAPLLLALTPFALGSPVSRRYRLAVLEHCLLRKNSLSLTLFFSPLSCHLRSRSTMPTRCKLRLFLNARLFFFIREWR